MPVSFRPHKIRKVYDDTWVTLENGDVVQGNVSYGELIKCRYEPNGRAASINLGDGKVYMYNYTVYLDRNAPEFKYGESVQLFGLNGECMGKYVVLGFHRGQLDCKIWV